MRKKIDLGKCKRVFSFCLKYLNNIEFGHKRGRNEPKSCDDFRRYNQYFSVRFF